jgi:hypothetical protein
MKKINRSSGYGIAVLTPSDFISREATGRLLSKFSLENIILQFNSMQSKHCLKFNIDFPGWQSVVENIISEISIFVTFRNKNKFTSGFNSQSNSFLNVLDTASSHLVSKISQTGGSHMLFSTAKPQWH